MKENEILKEAFSKLSEHQVTPPSNVWSGIEQSVQSGVVGGSAGGGFAGTILGKIAIGVVVIGTAIAAVVLTSPNEEEKATASDQVTVAPIITEDSVTPSTEKSEPAQTEKSIENFSNITKENAAINQPETNHDPSETAETTNPTNKPITLEQSVEEVKESASSSRSMAGFDQEYLDEYISNQSNQDIKVVDVDFRSSQDENNPLMWTFRNTSENGLEYLWSFGDGTTSDLENPTHLFEKEGSYTVELVVKGSFNQVSSISQSLNIYFPADWSNVPNIFTPNGDGDNDQFDPMHNAENLRFESIAIFDIKTGKEVFRSNSEAHLWEGYNLEGDICEPGIYRAIIVGLQNDGNYSTTEKTVLLTR